jgi:hypothetical protein
MDLPDHTLILPWRDLAVWRMCKAAYCACAQLWKPNHVNIGLLELSVQAYSRSHLEFPKLEEAISLAAIVMKIQKVVQKMRDP